jgi:hypothetical protein
MIGKAFDEIRRNNSGDRSCPLTMWKSLASTDCACVRRFDQRELRAWGAHRTSSGSRVELHEIELFYISLSTRKNDFRLMDTWSWSWSWVEPSCKDMRQVTYRDSVQRADPGRDSPHSCQTMISRECAIILYMCSVHIQL